MRILAGKFRRRPLKTNPGRTTRPLTVRAKAMLFDRLQWSFKDRRVADVFSGTGTLGLEALSRGARSVVFIESDRRAQHLLRQNVDSLHAVANTLCWRVDALRCSFKPKGANQWYPYDVIFCDPPYALATQLHPPAPLYRALQRLARDEVSAADACLMLRLPVDAINFQIPPEWSERLRFDVASMSVYLFDRTQAVR